MRPAVLTAAALVVLALVAGGCSNESEGAGATTAEESIAEETSPGEATVGGAETQGSTGGTFASDDCSKLVELANEYGKAIGAASSGGTAGDIAASAAAFREFADQVPEVIRDDFEVMADTFARYAEVVQDVDFSAGQAPDAAALARLQALFTGEEAERVQAASQRINDWSSANCAP